jgi:hypothetical protein
VCAAPQEDGHDEEQLHKSCVEPMLNRLFHGENCTILAYGQTGMYPNTICSK